MVIAQRVEFCLVIIAVTEARTYHHQPFGIVADIEFVSDTHTAMELNRLAKNLSTCPVDHNLERMHCRGDVFVVVGGAGACVGDA